MDVYDENSSIFRLFSGVLIAVRWWCTRNFRDFGEYFIKYRMHWASVNPTAHNQDCTNHGDENHKLVARG